MQELLGVMLRDHCQSKILSDTHPYLIQFWYRLLKACTKTDLDGIRHEGSAQSIFKEREELVLGKGLLCEQKICMSKF